jgi:hypothetical protein
MVELTLAVHPRFGESAQLLRRYGPDAVWLEFADGQVMIVPRSWTSLVPQSTPLRVDDQPARLAPDAAMKLASWIAARRAPRGQKLDAPIESGEKAVQDGRRRRRSGRDQQAASVVEQTRASDRRRPSGRPRGRR